MTPSPPTSTLFPYAALFRSAQAVTLSNPSGAALTITSIGFTGTNPGDFGQTNNWPRTPLTFSANDTSTINVTFTPTVIGSRSATLTVTDNASNNPQTAGASGTGAGLPGLSPSPVPDFGNQNVNTPSDRKSVVQGKSVDLGGRRMSKEYNRSD